MDQRQMSHRARRCIETLAKSQDFGWQWKEVEFLEISVIRAARIHACPWDSQSEVGPARPGRGRRRKRQRRLLGAGVPFKAILL
jgi:hypothetical protein